MSSLEIEHDGPVLRLTLSNPERRNALTWQMYDALEGIEPLVADDPALRAVVLRGAGGGAGEGAGEGAFAAGTDIRQFAEFTTGAQGVEYEHRIGRVLESLLRIRVPVVAVVDGPAVGAGLALAACADLVVATPDAVFGAPVARTLGNTLPPLVLARLFQRLGVGRTMGMALTARLLPATELDGFVTDVVERDQLDKHVDDVVQRICTNAPLTLSSLKEIERRVLRDGPAAAADDVLELVYGSRDFRAGVAGFLNHERVEWEGR